MQPQRAVKVSVSTAKRSARGTATLITNAACALAGITGCNEFELPEPPDMSALNRAYNEPDGELTTETAAELGARMVDSVSETQATSPIELMGEMITSLQETSSAEPHDDTTSEEDESSSQSVLGEKLDVAAIVRLHHKCRGFADQTSEADNGTLDIVATLDSDGLIPTIWGTAKHCRHVRRGFDVELDGDVRVRIGERPRVSLGVLTRLPYLVEFEGHAVVVQDGEHSEFDLHTHFRVMPDEKIQLLVALPDGTFVIGVFNLTSLANSSEPVISGGLLTRDSSWTCTIDLSTTSGTCTDENDPTSTIEW